MTAVPTTSGTALLICDQCGRQESVAETSPDSEMVWPLVASLGWSGSPFAIGAHRCPPCSVAELPPAGDGRDVQAPPHSATYDIRACDDCDAVVITPLHDMDSAMVEALRDGLMTAAGDYENVVVDLREAQFIDSSGLGLLVRARQEARSHGGTVSLAAPSRFVLTVLHTMRLEAAFPQFPDQATALQQVSTSGGRPGQAG